MNCLALHPNSGSDLHLISNSELQLDLLLPVEKIHEIDDKTFFSFNEEQFRIILKIYTTYKVLSKINAKLLDSVENSKKQRNIAAVTLYQCVDTLKAVNSEREQLHAIRDDDLREIASKERKEKIKKILTFTGVGVVGFGFGVLFGALAVRR
jgi:hypothetical protein